MKPERGRARGDIAVGIAAVVFVLAVVAFPGVLILRSIGALKP